MAVTKQTIVKITDRSGLVTIYEKTGDSVQAVIRDAAKAGASLRNADLSKVDLSCCDLSKVDLRGALLSYADLRETTLSYANLAGADFTGAKMAGAKLDNAKLEGACFHFADLTGASLTSAILDSRTDFTYSTIGKANLTAIRDDFFAVLSSAPAEVGEVIKALREGRVDGSTYNGSSCSCLVGTIAKARGCSVDSLQGLKADSSRPAERWFMGIRPGQTHSNSLVAQQAHKWAEEWVNNIRALVRKCGKVQTEITMSPFGGYEHKTICSLAV